MSKKIPTHKNRLEQVRSDTTKLNRDKLVRVYGLHACRAVIQSRPDDVRRVLIERRHLKEFDKFLHELAKQRRAYQVVSSDELSKLTRTVHHEGISLLAVERKSVKLDELLESKPSTLLVLDGVANPHNLGAIVRTCAYFGVDAVICESANSISPSSMRIAEGGGEIVPIVVVPDSGQALKRIKNEGFVTIAADPSAEKSLFKLKFPKKIAFIFGAEGSGVSKELSESAQHLLKIPGSGMIQSLNVSSAVAVFLAELNRQRLGD